jgi:hypothetical protein
MLRIRVTLSAIVICLVMAAPAFASSNGGGQSKTAPGQTNAKANCHDAFVNQDSSGVEAGGGPKAGETGPLNCDHYWQNVAGVIGNGS